jgi:flagellar biosynthetic protein FliP
MKALPRCLLALVLAGACGWVSAAAPAAIELRLPSIAGDGADLAMPIRIMLLLTLLSLAPAILVTMTAFTRIVVVLSMLRHAIGMQETPPNQVLVSLALFLSLFAMMPVLTQINEQAFQPYSAGKIRSEQAVASPLTTCATSWCARRVKPTWR